MKNIQVNDALSENTSKNMSSHINFGEQEMSNSQKEVGLHNNLQDETSTKDYEGADDELSSRNVDEEIHVSVSDVENVDQPFLVSSVSSITYHKFKYIVC